jgi:hypothetical protein
MKLMIQNLANRWREYRERDRWDAVLIVVALEERGWAPILRP